MSPQDQLVPDQAAQDLQQTLQRLIEESQKQQTLAGWMRENLPAWLTEDYLLLEVWQWCGLGVLLFGGVLADRLFCALLMLGLRRTFRAETKVIDSEILRRALRPFGWLVMAGIWWIGINKLDLPRTVTPIFAVAIKFVAMVACIWGSFRVVDVLAAFMLAKAERTASKLDDVLIPLVRKTLKLFIFAFGLVFIADNLGTDVTSLLAGLGLGGLAFALAAQDTVKNLFGTLTILLDRTYQVGDWVKTQEVEGTVEYIGFRSSKIRTFYNSVITLPNSNLITASVDNFGKRSYRRWKTNLSITYNTPPDRIEAFCEGLRELVRRHPYTRKDYFHVYLNSFAAASLEVLLYTFHQCPDWGTELRERHRLMLDILRLANRLGVEFAFPTQTLYLERGGAASPAAETSPDDVRDARSSGRVAAREIVAQTLGSPATRPPPVRFDIPAEENRGEGEG